MNFGGILAFAVNQAYSELGMRNEGFFGPSGRFSVIDHSPELFIFSILPQKDFGSYELFCWLQIFTYKYANF